MRGEIADPTHVVELLSQSRRDKLLSNYLLDLVVQLLLLNSRRLRDSALHATPAQCGAGRRLTLPPGNERCSRRSVVCRRGDYTTADTYLFALSCKPYNDAACRLRHRREPMWWNLAYRLGVGAEMSTILPHKKTSTFVAPTSLVGHWQASGGGFGAGPSPPHRRSTTDPVALILRIDLGRTKS